VSGYKQRLRLCNLFLHGSCNTSKGVPRPYPVAAWCHAITSKGTGLQSPALSLLKSLPALCRAELAEPLSPDSAQTEPCAPIRDKFAFGKFCFFIIITYLLLKNIENIDRKPSLYCASIYLTANTQQGWP